MSQILSCCGTPVNRVFYKKTEFNEDYVIISVCGYEIFWPEHFIHAPVLGALQSVFYNEADNYFRFYTPQPDDVVFDLGACEGFFSLCLRGKVRKVYAFEPFPKLCGSLSLTLERDIIAGNTEVCNYAVGDKAGSADFFVDDDLVGSTLESSRVADPTAKKISVRVISIDEFVREKGINKVSMIKMDVEGAEYSVLEGACEVMEKFSPALIITTYHYPHDYERLTGYLTGKGYHVQSGPLVMTNQGGQERPWYRHAVIYAVKDRTKAVVPGDILN